MYFLLIRKLLVCFFASCLLLEANGQGGNVPAAFPGGDTAWNQYLDTSFNRQTIISNATKKDIEKFGRTQEVSYGFGIMTDGRIDLISIQGQVSQTIRNEIQRVLKNSPRWKPATVDGKPVVYRMKQVSVFRLE